MWEMRKCCKMANKGNLKYFSIALVVTFFLVRFGAYTLTDSENYSKNFLDNQEKSKTITGILRQNIGFDLHHIHFGIILFIVLIPLIYFGFANIASIVSLGIGTSLVIDQIFPLLEFGNYFGYLMLMISLLLHLIILEVIAMFMIS